MLPRLWQSRALAWPLWPLSLLYAMVTGLRRRLYRSGLLPSTRLPVPVLVVGNVVAGGSGKTPVTIALVQQLQAQGWRVGVLSRGYGRSTSDCREVLPDSPAHETGDEPALIRRQCGVPVFVASQRAEAGLALLARHPQTELLLCDDGLQHLALARDLEICVFDDRGVGNGWLLPAGPLRERWPRPADLVLHTGDQPAFAGFRAHRALAPQARRADGQSLTLAELADTPVLALAGIAGPQRFFAMLRAAGLRRLHELPLPDHHDFQTWAPPDDAPPVWLCTEKDAVKLWARFPGAWAVPLRVDLDAGAWQALQARLAELRMPQVP